jgi:hypothetical protein
VILFIYLLDLGTKNNYTQLSSAQVTEATTDVYTFRRLPSMDFTGFSDVQVPSRTSCFNGKSIVIPEIPNSDPTHLVNKVRQVVLRHVLAIGDRGVSYKPLIDALHELGDFAAESLLNIRISDVVKPDRMDFRASQRLFSKSVIDFTKKITGAEGTAGLFIH